MLGKTADAASHSRTAGLSVTLSRSMLVSSMSFPDRASHIPPIYTRSS